MFARVPTHSYQDPLERIWIHCARRIGFEIVRTSEAYASYDGKGRILIATPDQFDADDNLGQMIFHELCHALVQGEPGEKSLDWGLDNTRSGNPWREHACLRVQAWLSDQHGLRPFLAPTTDYRITFWNQLGDNPLEVTTEEGGFREKSVVAARVALWRSCLPRWQQPLQEALSQTRRIALILREIGLDKTETHHQGSLWTTFIGAPEMHPSGVAVMARGNDQRQCSHCAWSFAYRGTLRCRKAPKIRLRAEVPACAAYESSERLDCLTCGACCREAYDSVEVGTKDPVRSKHPHMVIQQGTRLKLKRHEERCAALEGGKHAQEPYSCSIYEDRPRTCRDFTLGSENCLEARRKVGLSI